jgi:hypothetical protein
VQAKNSVKKALRAQLLELYPKLEEDIDVILPKKGAVYLTKWCAFRLHLRI